MPDARGRGRGGRADRGADRDHGRRRSTDSRASSRSTWRVRRRPRAHGRRHRPGHRRPALRRQPARRHLGYGASPDVVTSQELETMLVAGRARTALRRADAEARGLRPVRRLARPGSPALLLVASAARPRCARWRRSIATSARASRRAVVYRDMRTPGQLEHFYLGVQARPGSLFTRGEVGAVSRATARLTVSSHDSLLGEDVALDADLVVLAAGMVPDRADGEAIRCADRRPASGRDQRVADQQREEAQEAGRDRWPDHEGTEILNLGYRQGPDLPALTLQLPRLALHLLPVRDPPDRHLRRRHGAGADGRGAGGRGRLRRGDEGGAVHREQPSAARPCIRAPATSAVPDFFLQRCTQCKRCTEECPFGTLNEDAKGTPEYNPLRCRRCGICMGACPERIISFPDYSVRADRRDDQGDGGARRVRGEAPHPRLHVRERRDAGARRGGRAAEPSGTRGSG